MSCTNQPSDINQTFIIESGPNVNNIFTTGATLINDIVYFDRTDILSAYTLSLSALVTDNTYVTGITYSNNVLRLNRNDGVTLTTQINSFSGLTVNGTLSATTYLGLPTDVRVTGGTYSNGTAVFTNNTGGTFNVTGFTTGSTFQNLQQVTDIGNTTSNSIISTDGNVISTLSPNGLNVGRVAGGLTSNYTNGAIELGDLNGGAGFASFVVDETGQSIGFNFQNNNFAGNTNLILAPEFYTSGNSFNTYYIPFKEGNGNYTLATIEDLSGFTTGNTLQQVTDYGDTTSNNITIISDDSLITVQTLDGGSYTAVYNSQINIVNNFGDHLIAVYDDNIYFAKSGNNKTFSAGTLNNSNSFYNLPDKVSGNYILATLDDISGATSGFTLQGVTDYGNTTDNAILIYDGPDNLNLYPTGVQINMNSIGQGSQFVNGALGLGDLNGGAGVGAFIVDEINDNIGFNFQNINFATSANVILHPDFYVSGGSINNYYIPFKEGFNNYTLATTYDIIAATSGYTGNTLQAVTDNGNITTNPIIVNNGTARIQIGDDGSGYPNGILLFDESIYPGAEAGLYSNFAWEIRDLYGTGASIVAEVDSGNGNIRISFGAGSSSANLKLPISFGDTFQNYDLFFPIKPSGGYIIATLDDISGATGSQNLQQVLDNGNTAEGQYINLVNALSNQIETNLISNSQILLQDLNTTSDVRAINITPFEVNINSTDNDTGIVKQVSFDRDGVIFINNPNQAVGRITNLNSTDSISLVFPNKVAGNYTIATVEDLPSTPSLQQVTDAGFDTTNNIVITSDTNLFSIQNVSGQQTSNMGPDGFQNVASSGLYNSILNSNSLIFNDGLKQKILSKGNYLNTGGIYQLPDKAAATYTLATTSDLIGFITQDIRVTGGTYSAGTTTFRNNTGGTFSVSGYFTGATDIFTTGGTFNKSSSTLIFTNNSGGTFSVTGLTDINITGFTYSNNNFSLINNTGGTLSINVNNFSGLTVNGSLSATTYLGLPLDIRVTGGTYSAGTAVFTNNTGGTFNVTGFTTGFTLNSLISTLGYVPFNKNGDDITGTTGNGYLGLTSQSSTPTTPASGLMKIFADASGRFTWLTNLGFTRTLRSASLTGNRVYTLQDRDGILIDDTDFATKLSLSGGTVTGATIFNNGLTANTISATTYSNLPLDVRVTGGTYSAGTAVFTNNTGGTFNVTGFTTGSTSSVDTYVSGYTYNNANTFTLSNNTGGTMSATINTVTGLTVNQGIITITGLTLTGSVAQSSIDIVQSWNTTGTPTAFKLNVINSASNNNSLLMDIQVGGSSQFSITRNGGVVTFGQGNITIINALNTVATNGNAYTTASNQFTSQRSFAPTNGNAQSVGFLYQNTINQTGGASGKTAGYQCSPTLTSAYDFRALDIASGSVVFPYIAKGTTYSISNNDHFINVTGGTFTLTLPTAVGNTGKVYKVKNSSTGTTTIATTSSQTIDGVTAKTINTQYSGFEFRSDGANWMITGTF